MNTFDYKCPHCGVHLELNKDDPLKYCPYCGGKLHIDVQFKPEEQKTVESKINQIKNRVFSFNSNFGSDFKSINVMSSKNQSGENRILLFIILGIIGLVLLFVFLFSLLNTKSVVPFSQEYANKKQYSALLTALDNSGFYNYSIVPISDEEYADNYKDGQVIEVTVNGKAKYSTKKKYKVDKTNILIRFYSPDGKIALPISSNGILGQNENKIEKALKTHGFNNITETREEGLIGKIIYDDWEIIRITINGSSSFESGDRLAPDVPIYIKYYLR